MRRIASLLWNADKPMAIINVLLQIIQSFLPIASLYYIKTLIEAIVEGKSDFNTVTLLIVVFAGIQFLIAIASQVAGYITTLHQQKLTDYLTTQVLHKAANVDYEYYETPAYYDTLHLAQQQSLHKASLLLVQFNAVLLNSLSLIFLAGFFFSLHSYFAMLFIALSLPLAAIKWFYGFLIARQESKLAPIERETNYINWMLTSLNPAKEVRALSFGKQFIKKFGTLREIIYKEKKGLQKKLIIYSMLAESVEIIAMSFVFIMLAKSAWQKTITVGLFIVYIQGFQRLQSTSRGFLQAIVQLLQQRIFLKDLFSFLDLSVTKSSGDTKAFPQLKKGIAVQDLSYSYPLSEREVLHNISITCQPGKVIAIVGKNGSGKSTLVKLLSRLYDSKTGSITVEDIPLIDINIDDYRQKTLFVFQDFEKYFISVEENIALGDERGVDEIRVQQAGKMSGADEFIAKLQKGYKTRLGKLFSGSEQLSGGEWQKLILSRVFYRDSQLIVLDEPTSALDAVAELELFKNIKDNIGNKMVILITHRLYNLKIADHIYLMQDGRIAEEGSFESLLYQKGAFAALYDAQKL
ncbi:MAG: ABC transporter ATP-binding protein [Bacteroidetes bacterium]|nr:ABC transporter ATP-binding protein [Bacteroidota bacterium]